MTDVKPLPSVVSFSTVCVSGLLGWTIVHPFSTLTIRMSLSHLHDASDLPLKQSFRSFAADSIKKDGFKSLYNGLSAGLLRQFFYATSIFGLFEVFRDELAKHREIDFASRMVCGVASGGEFTFH
jgi:solute carrier family 25 oxoglutarate transporter 11